MNNKWFEIGLVIFFTSVVAVLFMSIEFLMTGRYSIVGFGFAGSWMVVGFLIFMVSVGCFK